MTNNYLLGQPNMKCLLAVYLVDSSNPLQFVVLEEDAIKAIQEFGATECAVIPLTSLSGDMEDGTVYINKSHIKYILKAQIHPSWCVG